MTAFNDFGDRPAFTLISQNSDGLGTFASYFIVIMYISFHYIRSIHITTV
ncbi:hypothetical protein VCRA217O315_260042 [Vibrio crassostreae]|nr:hypothetical protein VCRA217O315_260042 [Vibrio crassostreae]